MRIRGHSQGGQGAIFTAAHGPDWAPELQLLGSVALQASQLATAAGTRSHQSY
jgi:hypothetical protein